MIVGDLVRETKPLLPDDGVGKAVALLRQAPASALPVVSEGIVIGIVSEADLTRFLQEQPGLDPEKLGATPVASLMRTPVLCLAAPDTLDQAAQAFARHSLKAAPVVSPDGQYQGMVTRADLLAALFGTVAPPRIGGLATPLGVYLTTGAHRGGAGTPGLVLAGVALTIIYFVSRMATNGLAWLLERYTDLPLFTAKLAADHGTEMGLFAPMYQWVLALMGLELLGFFLLLRLSPISGTHAAEHQTVHAIEQGEALTLERVARMPRVHPRCGTNLMALVFVLMIATTAFMSLHQRMAAQSGPGGVMLGILVIFFAVSFIWRRLGAGLQQFVTTKQATPAQLANGIAAGEQLLARYRAHPSLPVTPWRRLLNMGIIQIALGFVAATYALTWLSGWLGLGF